MNHRSGLPPGDLPTGASPPSPDLAALSGWAPELAKTFVSLASDIALVIDAAGVIRSVAQGTDQPISAAAQGWVGRAWIDTVSGDTRPKIEHLLREVTTTGIARRREVNHPLGPELSVPVAYTAIRLGDGGPVLAVGRDLRAIAAIQQRFIESQQDLERGYWQARHAESRYRLLFQVATDAVLVVDAETLLIAEVNQAAAQLFGMAPEQLHGRHIDFGFEHHSRGAVNELLSSARGNGVSGELRARLQGSLTSTSVAATPFRADDAMRLLVRVRIVEPPSAAPLNTTLARLVDDTHDGVVVTDSSGRVLLGNPAFLALVQLRDEAEVKGRLLTSWLGLPEQPLSALLQQARREGVVRRIDSWARPAHAPALRVEISAALLAEGDQECIGFTIRRAAAAPAPSGHVAAAQAGLDDLAARLGEVPLDELLRQAARRAQHHLIRCAWQRAGRDAAAAAALLGIGVADVERELAGLDTAADPTPAA